LNRGYVGEEYAKRHCKVNIVKLPKITTPMQEQPKTSAELNFSI